METLGVVMLDHNNLSTILNRGVSEIIVKDEFVSLLQEGKPLRLKMGFDPSRPDIHLGYVVALRKLRALQELGHRVILIVGDWTAQIGDPSGQSATRIMLSHEEVLANAKTYMEQFFKVVDKERTDTVFQSEWFGKFKLEDVINLTSKFTVAQFLERDDFSIRFKANRPIALTEFLYPLLQAYDSVVIKSDVEFGGTDQKFNLLVGRELQAMMGQRPQQCFLNPLLVGTDGVRKRSQSFDNYIGLEDLPNDMFGKLMSIADNLIINYFEYLTDVADSELEEMTKAIEEESVNPMDLKKQLSLDITSQFHGSEKAFSAQSNFEKVVQRRLMPDDMPEIGFQVEGSGDQRRMLFIRLDGTSDRTKLVKVTDQMEVSIFDLLFNTGLVSSISEAKRLVAQGAVEINHCKITEGVTPVHDGLTIKAGRRRFLRLIDFDAR